MGLVEKFAVVEMDGTAGRGNYEVHPRTRTVGPRIQHGPDRKEQATSHSKLRLCTLLC